MTAFTTALPPMLGSPARELRLEKFKINHFVFPLTLLLPILLSFFNPQWRFPQFTPRQLIYAKDFLPLLTAFWASPVNHFAYFSRFFQAAVVASSPRPLAYHLLFIWIIIALARTLSGFLLSRTVGWTYPRLFNHWALYETSSGIGPALAVYLIMYGSSPWTYSRLQKYPSDTTELLAIISICFTMCYLDNAPWTYAMASITSAVLWFAQAINTFSLRHNSHSSITLDARRLRTVLQTAILFLLLIPVHFTFTNLFSTNITLPMPTSPHETAPLLEILIISHPRPGDTPSLDSLLAKTISSYLPFVDSNTVLSVFTHATPHVSFTHAKDHYAQTPIVFYTDTEIHPDSYSAQHLHVAEAFRWAFEKNPSRAEWVMLVEDDFPLCGEWGWKGILGVMNELQRDAKYGGFVGTGGSGLIIHHSLLPILTYTLQIHALQYSPIPPSVPLRPVDIIIQDCLFGSDLLCPHNTEEPMLVITSRLVMDHIGGNASTTQGRVYSPEKWRCGWRHPFHGLMEVQVIPV